MNIIELIERSANTLQDNECWTLDRIPHSSGYVYVQNRRLHRVAWEAHNAEPIPEGMVVLHSCDNRECFNPAHLSVGTQQENIHDAMSKGRYLATRTNVADYDEILDLLEEGYSHFECACIANVSTRTVDRAIAGSK